MNTLQTTVHRIYGKRLVQRATQGNAHFLFTTFDDEKTQETYYMKVVELPTFLYISEATTELIHQKYGSLVPAFQITPIDRNFQAYTYLVRSPINILPLGTFLQIKKDCGQPLDIDFFLRFLEFAKNSFKILEKHALPLLSLKQIGITEKGEFLLSDPACYFSGHQKMTIKEDFGSWIQGFVREVLNLPLNVEEQEGILREYFGEYLNAIRPFFEYLMSGQATLEETEEKLISTISRFSDDISTITASFVDINETIERSFKGSIPEQKIKFNKMGKLAKIIIIVVVIALVGGVGFFVFKFFNRSVQCMQGEFLDSNKLCVSCYLGCLRCEDSQPDRCTKCDLNMYLVIANEQDKQGYCLTECKGRMIRVGVCVSDGIIGRSSQELFNLSEE